MGILTPQENQAAIAHLDTALDEAFAYCNSKIQEAMLKNEKFARIVPGIPYGEFEQQRRLEEHLTQAGYRCDSEDQVRAGLVIDVEWD